MENIKDGFILSTGKKFYANQSIIGIDPELNLSEGYDGGIILYNWYVKEFTFTKEERGDCRLYDRALEEI